MIELQKLINNPQIVAEKLSQLQPLPPSKVMDRVFPADKRKTHPFAQIGIEEISDLIQTVPLVRRGAPGVSLNQVTGLTMYIEPQPIRIEDRIGANEANNIKALGKSYDEYLNALLDRIRLKVRATTEALAAQSLNGVIQYPLLLENGAYTTYEVDFTRGGTNPINTYTPTVTWDNQNATLGTILDDLVAIKETLQEYGWGENLIFWAGKSAFSALKKVLFATKTESKIKVTIEQQNIDVAGFVIEQFSYTYRNPQTGQRVKIVNDKELLVWDADAPFRLFYLAIDHFKAGLQAMPLFLWSYESERGDALNIFAESKPLPCPVVKAICKAQVVA